MSSATSASTSSIAVSRSCRWRDVLSGIWSILSRVPTLRQLSTLPVFVADDYTSHWVNGSKVLSELGLRMLLDGCTVAAWHWQRCAFVTRKSTFQRPALLDTTGCALPDQIWRCYDRYKVAVWHWQRHVFASRQSILQRLAFSDPTGGALLLSAFSSHELALAASYLEWKHAYLGNPETPEAAVYQAGYLRGNPWISKLQWGKRLCNRRMVKIVTYRPISRKLLV
jgi:hypothetical protein